MPSNSLTPLLWFAAVIVMIPLALWLLRRTPLGGGGAGGVMRTVATLPISPSQRLMTVEIGQGEDRRWLVLGVSPGGITTLHTMAPQADPADPDRDRPMRESAGSPFARMLGKLRHPGDGR